MDKQTNTVGYNTLRLSTGTLFTYTAVQTMKQKIMFIYTYKNKHFCGMNSLLWKFWTQNIMKTLHNDAHIYIAIWITVLDINKRTQFSEVQLLIAVTWYTETNHALKMTHNSAIIDVNGYQQGVSKCLEHLEEMPENWILKLLYRSKVKCRSFQGCPTEVHKF